MKYNDNTKKGIISTMENIKEHLDDEEQKGRVPVGIIIVTVEPFECYTAMIANKTVEGALVKMGFVDEDEITAILSEHTKKISHEVRKKLLKGIPGVIEKLHSERE